MNYLINCILYYCMYVLLYLYVYSMYMVLQKYRYNLHHNVEEKIRTFSRLTKNLKLLSSVRCNAFIHLCISKVKIQVSQTNFLKIILFLK